MHYNDNTVSCWGRDWVPRHSQLAAWLAAQRCGWCAETQAVSGCEGCDVQNSCHGKLFMPRTMHFRRAAMGMGSRVVSPRFDTTGCSARPAWGMPGAL